MPLSVASATTCDGVPTTWEGNDSDNVHDGGPGSDSFALFGGDDKSNGLGSFDHICGGTGSDLNNLRGGSEQDGVHGGPGADDVMGDDYNDRLYGETGDNDYIYDGFGSNDYINGGDRIFDIFWPCDDEALEAAYEVEDIKTPSASYCVP